MVSLGLKELGGKNDYNIPQASHTPWWSKSVDSNRDDFAT